MLRMSTPEKQTRSDVLNTPGGGDFDNFFSKMSKSPPFARSLYPLPPLGLDTDRCIKSGGP